MAKPAKKTRKPARSSTSQRKKPTALATTKKSARSKAMPARKSAAKTTKAASRKSASLKSAMRKPQVKKPARKPAKKPISKKPVKKVTAKPVKKTAVKPKAQTTTQRTKIVKAEKPQAPAPKPFVLPTLPKPPEPKKPKKFTPAFSPSTMAKFRQALETERDRLIRQAEELAAEAEALATEREQGDTQFDEESGEGDTISVERERAQQLSAGALELVEEINAALGRMEAGEYGYCIECYRKIPVARLEAVPWTDLCVECKARHERHW